MRPFLRLHRQLSEVGPGRIFTDHQSARDAVARLFPTAIQQSALQLALPGPPSSDQEVRIGVATWNGYDMVLLDLLDEKAREGMIGGSCFSVFDLGLVWEAGSHGSAYLPGFDLREAPQTPVVGCWQHGSLREVKSGPAARWALLGPLHLYEVWEEEVRRQLPHLGQRP